MKRTTHAKVETRPLKLETFLIHRSFPTIFYKNPLLKILTIDSLERASQESFPEKIRIKTVSLPAPITS